MHMKYNSNFFSRQVAGKIKTMNIGNFLHRNCLENYFITKNYVYAFFGTNN